MTAQECLKYIVKELHTVVFFTVDEKGYPVTCAIDMMRMEMKAVCIF